MAMQLLAADGDFADRMVALAGLPWSRRAVEDAFVANGWEVPEDEEEGPDIGWWEVQFLPGREEGADDWWLELGDPPGCVDDGSPDAVCAHTGCGAGSYVLHPFAYFADPEDPAAWDNEFGPWHSRPDVRGEATEADYDAEYLRMAALLRDRLGEPEPAGPWPYQDIDATRHVRWSRGGAYVILLDGNDAMSYGAYRRAGVAVRPKR
ncbi:hypothetical protein [Actinacidiphila glaucinigra]|uniref:Uncharacterized protein n=1 Tax=Actinacidiphila glaucinigra TaxID=235986 RepID=A0A239J711_9ACTN|nr:hypothetical protein [Actinacidiphila glaucinigra]SNT01816.1 hypothetical protein SAMN05216252_112125 [Actinacidiphila glaucinigra]